MNIEETKIAIKKYIEAKPYTYSQAIIKDDQLMESILLHTPLLPKEIKLKTRIYWILNDIISYPKCIVCGTEIISDVYTLEQPFRYGDPVCNNPICKKNVYKIHFHNHCEEKYGKGITSPMQCQEVKDKVRKTNLERYGATVAINSKEIRAKIEEESLRKNGVKNPARSKTANEKRRKTCLEKYGAETTLQSEEIKNKIKLTNIQRYGSESPLADPEIRKKCSETCLEKYGVSSYTQTDEYNEKVKKTCLEKYGAEHHLMNEGIKEKRHETVKEKYGVDNVFQSDEIKAKIKKTVNEKYGVEHISLSKDINEKRKCTCIEHFGTPYPIESEEVKAHILETVREKYGVDCVFQNEDIKDKIKKTMIEKYGVEAPAQLETVRRLTSERNHKIAYENLLTQEDIPMFSIEDFKLGNELAFKCHKCGETYKAKYINGYHHPCPKCFPSIGFGGTSISENELLEFLNTLIKPGEVIEKHNRKIIAPYEIDFYIPSRNLAIEFDGLFWHSEGQGKDKNYHLNKTEECEKQNIHLIHIFENEWITKTDIVKGRLKAIFGMTKRINARECSVKEIEYKTSELFLKENHIQGTVPSSINIGLFLRDELVAIMTFGKPRFNKKYDWELLRFANKRGYSVIGGCGKLLKYFETNYKPTSILSYADRRWSYSKSNVYSKLGFKLIGTSKPNYWYFQNSKEIFNRIRFQKHKLKNILEHFDESKSEIQNMMDNGYLRIFDCGQLIFIKEYTY